MSIRQSNTFLIFVLLIECEQDVVFFYVEQPNSGTAVQPCMGIIHCRERPDIVVLFPIVHSFFEV